MAIVYFIGIDVSKDTLDCSILYKGEFLSHQKIINRVSAINEWYRELRSLYKINKGNALFCFEQIGTYDNFLLKILCTKKANIWWESPLHIKRSLGLHRGKNDKIDSLRIAKYAYVHKDKFKPYSPRRKIIEQLRQLSSLRSRLKKAIIKLKNGVRDGEHFFDEEKVALVDLLCIRSMVALKQDFDATSDKILELIDSVDRLKHLFKIIISVPSVGNVLATELLIVTNEFLDITCPKKFACLCGVVPFDHSSGTSIKQRTHVSKMANIKMKTLLHMCAISTTCHDSELREYYKRRVNEGYPKMSAINAIRNKLIHRVFACVRENRPYQVPEIYKRFEPAPYAV